MCCSLLVVVCCLSFAIVFVALLCLVSCFLLTWCFGVGVFGGWCLVLGGWCVVLVVGCWLHIVVVVLVVV